MMMGFGFLFWLLILVVILALVIGGLRNGWRWQGQGIITPPSAGAHEDPKRLLQLRYARGEITREEYLRMLADLEGRTTE